MLILVVEGKLILNKPTLVGFLLAASLGVALGGICQAREGLSKTDSNLINYGLQLRAVGKNEAASATFDRCQHLENAPDPIILRICEIYNSNGQSPRALALIQPVVARAGSNTKAMLAAGVPYPLAIRSDCYNAVGEFEKAVADEVKLASLLPDGGKVYLVKAGDILRRIKKYNEALVLFDRALKLKASNEDCYLLISRGSCLQGLQRWDDAIANYTQILKLLSQPGRVDKKALYWAAANSYGERAKCYEHQKKYSQAQADRKKQEEMGRAVEDELFGNK
ncbi:MAG: hypothetical protein KGS72_22385 [Cyanobacteria bacterium REEB67]|nr:hypothetical protein [Cyanobacteria bacterium REEB67]